MDQKDAHDRIQESNVKWAFKKISYPSSNIIHKSAVTPNPKPGRMC